jgi:hypothetical protein
MDIQQVLYFLRHPFTVTHREQDQIKQDAALSRNEKIVAIAAGIFGLLGAVIGGPVAFYTAAFLLRKRKIVQLQLSAKVPNNPKMWSFDELMQSNLSAKELWPYAKEWTPYGERFALLKKTADLNHPEAMMQCAVMLQYGDYEEIPANSAQAMSWYEKAAACNQSTPATRNFAYAHLGDMYVNGQGVNVNLDKAKEMYKEGLKFGETVALNFKQDTHFMVSEDFDSEFDRIVKRCPS